MGTVIELQQVTKTYSMGENEVRALVDVNFSIEEGEFVSIMGPSGSGKSTCMNIIGCLDTPTSGDVIIAGKYTSKMTEKELSFLRNQTVGFVFQQYHLLPNMTVLENVMLPLRYKKIPPAERKALAQVALERMGLSERMSHLPHELSGGQKQRVAIARATVTEPKIILADEPTGALDSETGHNVIDLFKSINKNSGTTIVIITHDDGIGHSAPRTIHIFDGRIKKDERNV